MLTPQKDYADHHLQGTTSMSLSSLHHDRPRDQALFLPATCAMPACKDATP